MRFKINAYGILLRKAEENRILGRSKRWRDDNIIVCYSGEPTEQICGQVWKYSVYGLVTSLTKRQFIVTNRNTVLQEKEKNWQIPNRPIHKHVMSLRRHREKQFSCWHSILTAGVFVTQLPNNAEISILRIVWVTIKCCFYERHDCADVPSRFLKVASYIACSFRPANWKGNCTPALGLLVG